MQLNPDRAELLAAATDLLLAVLASIGVVRVSRREWRLSFLLLMIASLLGAIVHGFDWSEELRELWWWPLDFALAGTLACFAGAALRDGWGPRLLRHARMPLLATALVVAITARSYSQSFLPFLLYEAAVLLGATLLWSWIACARGALGAGRLAAGSAIAILAGIVAASGLRVGTTWPLNANTLFHLIQAPAVLLWISGARATASNSPPHA